MELNRIYLGDCLDILKLIPDSSIDVILTSPPYNLGNNHHTAIKKTQAYDDNMKEHEYQEWQIEIFKEFYRVLSNNGSVIYNHKNRIKGGIQISPYQWLFKTQFVVKQEIVWFNGTPNFDKCRFYPMTERIYWLSKTTQTDFFNTIGHHDFFNISEWKPEGTNKEHTRAFPLQFAIDILKCFPNSKTVLDPFMGSGTTAVACIELNKNYIGIEKEEKYVNLSNDRINEYTKTIDIME